MSLFVLDTNILTAYERREPAVVARVQPILLTDIAITVITVEEQLGGWYDLIHNVRGRDQLARAYQRLAESVELLAGIRILPFPEPAIARYEQLLALKLNVRKNDLRIAAIALENGAIVVTRNTRDFARVPDPEDWTQ